MTYYVRGGYGELDQGDILRPVEVRRYLSWWPDAIQRPLVIVTPTCDLAQDKADYHRLCILQPLQNLLYEFGKDLQLTQQHWDGAEPLSKGKWNTIKERLGRIIKNAWPRYHFLPSESDVFQTDYFIDFELILTVPLTELAAVSRHATIDSPYKQELVQRLTSHLMRIGTPDIAAATINEKVNCCAGAVGLAIPV